MLKKSVVGSNTGLYLLGEKKISYFGILKKRGLNGFFALFILFSILAFGLLTFINKKIIISVRSVVDSMDESADHVASWAGEVSSAAQHLAEGAFEQAASIEETLSSLEEISSMTKRNAENAGKANTLA